jgi:hypothetical protein
MLSFDMLEIDASQVFRLLGGMDGRMPVKISKNKRSLLEMYARPPTWSDYLDGFDVCDMFFWRDIPEIKFLPRIFWPHLKDGISSDPFSSKYGF